ncbi:MAG: sensor histidine kinase [Actinomycetota bacterium]|nr:sensor histidine kinase [Actinomycetota bacterium]
MRIRMRRLSSQIFVAQLAILTTTILIGFLLLISRERGHLDDQYQQRAASISQTTAQIPDIRRCIQHEAAGCAATVQILATDITHSTAASYVVIIDMNRVRHSHPDPALIGQRVSEPIVVTDGRTHIGVNDGNTGRSANARTPLYGSDGRLVGEVSVGLKESSVSAALWRELPSYAAWLGIALGLGALASWALARHLKQRTFGLELDEISLLLQEREATLHGVREGIIAFDTHGRVSMVNDEAQRLLGLGVAAVGHTLSELLPPSPLREMLDSPNSPPDAVGLTDDYALVVNRMPIRLAGKPNGAVVTLRDRTELAALLRELDGERGLTDSLRAQQHEFANRMHVVAGLLELGENQDAIEYLTHIQGTAAEFDNTLRTHIAAPQIVGLMLGKTAEANERGIQLNISPETWLSESPDRVQLLTMVLGNLIDNSMDALSAQPAPRRIDVEIVEEEDTVQVTVTDNGPGVPAELVQRIFLDGYSTKPHTGNRLRGLGLALVHRSVTKLGGSVTMSAGSGGTGATLCVTVPKERSASAHRDTHPAATR